MSNTAKIILAIIVVIILVGGIWWWVSNMQGPGGSPASPSAGQPTSQNNSTTAQSAPVLTSGNSNADLNQDLSQMDNQLNGLASDSSNIDQGLNDQPVTQQSL